MTPARDPESGLEIDSCDNCYGLWFDADELREFFKSSKLTKKFMLPSYGFEESTVDISLKARRCPRCTRQGLARIDVAGVAVDECEQCRGIWLDAGEVGRLVKMFEMDAIKTDSETARQIKQGLAGQGPLAQVSAFLSKLFGKLFGQPKAQQKEPEESLEDWIPEIKSLGS